MASSNARKFVSGINNINNIVFFIELRMDPSFMASRNVDLRTWTKQSHAPSRRVVNSSKSASALSDPFDLMLIGEIGGNTPYDGFWRDTHEYVCADIKEWICDLCNIPDGEMDTCVRINQSMPSEIMNGTLWTTKRKNPDVTTYSSPSELEQDEVELEQDEVELEVVIEVDSGNKDSTIFKLALDLIDHNRYYRNKDSQISGCTGFYFPVGTGVVEKVDCVWDDKKIKYKILCTGIAEADLNQTFRNVLQQTKAKNTRIRNLVSSNFTLPMSEQYISTTFGTGAHQLCSGDSIVIINSEREEVYKHPLPKDAYITLQMARKMEGLRHTAIPITSPSTIPPEYYTFKAYKPPLTHTEAKTHIVLFVRSVVRAIQELHSFNTAHLDIRLENICFNANNEAILIDIDRSRTKTKSSFHLFLRYSRAEMYRCESHTWTCENLDWKQLGLLIRELTSENHYFLQRLITQGELS